MIFFSPLIFVHYLPLAARRQGHGTESPSVSVHPPDRGPVLGVPAPPLHGAHPGTIGPQPTAGVPLLRLEPGYPPQSAARSPCRHYLLGCDFLPRAQAGRVPSAPLA